jgi:hypothetical protein
VHSITNSANIGPCVQRGYHAIPDEPPPVAALLCEGISAVAALQALPYGCVNFRAKLNADFQATVFSFIIDPRQEGRFACVLGNSKSNVRKENNLLLLACGNV